MGGINRAIRKETAGVEARISDQRPVESRDSQPAGGDSPRSTSRGLKSKFGRASNGGAKEIVDPPILMYILHMVIILAKLVKEQQGNSPKGIRREDLPQSNVSASNSNIPNAVHGGSIPNPRSGRREVIPGSRLSRESQSLSGSNTRLASNPPGRQSSSVARAPSAQKSHRPGVISAPSDKSRLLKVGEGVRGGLERSAERVVDSQEDHQISERPVDPRGSSTRLEGAGESVVQSSKGLSGVIYRTGECVDRTAVNHSGRYASTNSASEKLNKNESHIIGPNGRVIGGGIYGRVNKVDHYEDAKTASQNINANIESRINHQEAEVRDRSRSATPVGTPGSQRSSPVVVELRKESSLDGLRSSDRQLETVEEKSLESLTSESEVIQTSGTPEETKESLQQDSPCGDEVDKSNSAMRNGSVEVQGVQSHPMEVENPVKQSRITCPSPVSRPKPKGGLLSPRDEDGTNLGGPGSGIPKPTAAVKGTAKLGPLTRAESEPGDDGRNMANRKVSEVSNESGVTTFPRQRKINRPGGGKDELNIAMVSPMMQPTAQNSPAENRGNLLTSPENSLNRRGVPQNGDMCSPTDAPYSKSGTPSSRRKAELAAYEGKGKTEGKRVTLLNNEAQEKESSSAKPSVSVPSKQEKGEKQITEEDEEEGSGGGGGEEDAAMQIKPMQPLHHFRPSSSHFGFTTSPSQRPIISNFSASARNLTPPSVHLSSNSNRIGGGYMTDSGIGRCGSSPYARPCLPLRSVSGRRGMGTSSHGGDSADYSDLDSCDLASGYMSDGDVLRCGGGFGMSSCSNANGGSSLSSNGGYGAIRVNNRGYSEAYDGYMSEGGASLYARKAQASYSSSGQPLLIRED
ncbi:hypothetical protein J437_LFUL011877, partial [Ladona fulva]